MSGEDDARADRRSHMPPFSERNPIPTVGRFRDEVHKREADAASADELDDKENHGVRSRVVDTAQRVRHGPAPDDAGSDAGQPPYTSQNKNLEHSQQGTEESHDVEDHGDVDEGPHRPAADEEVNDPPEARFGQMDPRQKRKQMAKRTVERVEREVTDPVTHLPVRIHDFTSTDLNRTPQQDPSSGTAPRTLADKADQSRDVHAGMTKLFPPPAFDLTRDGLSQAVQQAVTTGLGALLAVTAVALALLGQGSTRTHVMTRGLLLLAYVTLGGAIVWAVRHWLGKKVAAVWENQVWEAERRQQDATLKSSPPESTHWLNYVLASVWPLVNPDLFTSVADTLEDVMQASLPKLVRMVSVDDIGQGSEALRILGVKWLPTGASAQAVCADGGLDASKSSARSGSHDADDRGNPATDGQSAAVVEGMEAEEGDFLNLEVAFAYRARTEAQGLRKRAKNMHLYMAFFLPSNIKLPVWVELRGLVGSMRLRLQLTPDPPFFALCTMTFLGQPKVEISCAPLSKKGLNIMDLPVISNFVQSSVDAAMAEYVAPKSLTLDLKDMLVGADFKKDTTATGVLVVRITRAYDFKEGDVGVGFLKRGSSDPYLTVGWAKFGKPLWATRVLPSEMAPHWDETAFLLVTLQELNVDERLRVQLWDSDRTSADDELGHIDLNLKHLMRDPASNGTMADRVDGFKAMKAGDTMPGTLEWSVGYYSKTRVLDSQLARQTEDPDITNTRELEEKVGRESESKLREARADESREVDQQKAQDLKDREDQLLISSPPSDKYPSGILSVQIHQIVGLELVQARKNTASQSDNAADDDEGSDDLPSGYCTVILNHEKIFKTRTKPKNSKPFYNAGCERFVRDWRSADLHISVRDARVHEEDALVGVVHLPLAGLLAERSQVDQFFPVAGGNGYGSIRISLVFRSVQLHASPPTLGWEYGTLDIDPHIRGVDLPHDLQGMRLKVRTTLSRGKLASDGHGAWTSKNDRPLRLPVRKRHSTPLVIEFRKSQLGSDRTAAFAVLWLKTIPDDAEQRLTLPVWTGDLARATACCLDTCGDRVGQIELRLKFCRGLSAYHYGLASTDPHVADIMDVLDAANDNDAVAREVDGVRSDTSSSSSSDSDSDGDADHLAADGKRGPTDQIKEYKQNRRELHRKNRGVMQWKGARTLPWLGHKFERGERHISGLFKHRDRDPGIETEV